MQGAVGSAAFKTPHCPFDRSAKRGGLIGLIGMASGYDKISFTTFFVLSAPQKHLVFVVSDPLVD